MRTPLFITIVMMGEISAEVPLRFYIYEEVVVGGARAQTPPQQIGLI
ncbi:hypothetical protein [Methanocrinis sp.]